MKNMVLFGNEGNSKVLLMIKISDLRQFLVNMWESKIGTLRL